MGWRWGTPRPVWTDKQTETITFPILRMQAVITLQKKLAMYFLYLEMHFHTEIYLVFITCGVQQLSIFSWVDTLNTAEVDDYFMVWFLLFHKRYMICFGIRPNFL